VPIITGTAAPLRVFGRAAKSHALGEFWIILLLAIVFYYLQFAKVNINTYICKNKSLKHMIVNTASLDLVEFVETSILPQYASFDKAHDLSHVTRVIKRSLDLARTTGADINMVYAIAAYHDIGMSGPRAVHHITGGKILAADARLRRWFTQDQIKIMREAIEDHRASASHAPRSIYGKIVAEADRDLDPEVLFRRTVQYGLSNYSDLDKEHQWMRFREHLLNKYSVNGYIRLWIPGSDNERKLNEVRNTIANPSALRVIFEQLYEEETKLG
jgi:uncharacterized protein